MTTAIIRRDTKTAEELVKALSPDSDLWNGRVRDWIFRGVDDSRHGLLPAAYRDPPPPVFEAGALEKQQTNHPNIFVQTERQLFERFLAIANDSGLSTARGAESYLRRKSDEQLRREQVDTQGWPSEDLIPALALAQHHGVPTRMLDWSRRPLIAAYFAVHKIAEKLRDPCQKKKPDWNSFCVWGLNLNAVEPQSELGKRFQLIILPRADNANLHAQHGVFLLDREYLDGRGSLDDVVAKHNVNGALVCVTAPVSEAPKTLRLLAYDHNVSGSTLFPGYDGVVRQARERWYWDIS